MTSNSGAPEVRVSVRDSLSRGLMPAMSDLAAILTEVEKQFTAKPSGTSVEAYGLLDRAAKQVDPSYSGGLPDDLLPVVIGQDKLLLNAGGVKSWVRATGEILVLDAQDNILLHLVPPP